MDEARNQFLAIVSHELRTPLTSIVSFSELIRGEAGRADPGGPELPGHHRAERRPAAPADRRPAHAGPARGRRAAAGPGPGLHRRPGRPRRSGPRRRARPSRASPWRSRPFPGPAGGGRLAAADAGAGQPDRQRGQVLAPERAGPGHRRAATGRHLADRRGRLRHRHPPGRRPSQLFSRFVRASNARTAGLPGTGLGLSIVKVLTEMHGGHVEVRQRPGPRQHVQRLPAGGVVSPAGPAPASVRLRLR